MIVREAEPADHDCLIEMLAEFRVTMSRFRGSAPPPDLAKAEQRLLSYQPPEHQVFVAESDKGNLAAYMVCRTKDHHVSVEMLYVMPEHRRQGVGSMLYDRAEVVALELGDEPITNWVHPSNDRFIAFLRKRGYVVMTLLELRRPRAGEGPLQQIKVGKNIFEFCC